MRPTTLSFQENRYSFITGNIAGLSAILTAFFIPISITLMDIFYVLMVVSSILTPQIRHQYSKLIKYPVVIFIVLYMLLFIIGSFYGWGTWHNRFRDINKHYWIIGTVFIMPIFSDPNWCRYTINGFLAAMALTLFICFGMMVGVFKQGIYVDYSVFLNHIQQGLLMSIAAGVFLYRGLTESAWRKLYLTLSLLAVINVMFISKGRTAYFQLGAVLLVLAYTKYQWRGLLTASLAFSLLASLAFMTSPDFRERIDTAIHNTKTYQANAKQQITSVGIRYAMADNAYYLFKKRPWMGYGSGSLGEAFKSLPASMQSRVRVHDQIDLDYFNIALRFGVVGLLIVFGLFLTAWLQGKQLNEFECFLARAVIVTFALGCTINDLMNRATTGRFLSLMLALSFGALLVRTCSTQKR